jgi:hypothetical protein
MCRAGKLIVRVSKGTVLGIMADAEYRRVCIEINRVTLTLWRLGLTARLARLLKGGGTIIPKDSKATRVV